MKIDYVLGSLNLKMFGAFRYTKECYDLIKDKIDLKVVEYEKVKVKFPSFLKYFYDIWVVKKNLRKNSICHITTQANAHMLHYINHKKTVVTCYDLIPYLFLNDEKSFLQRQKIKSWFNGLKKAERILAISEFTKQEIIKYLGYPKKKIHVAYPAVDHSKYKPLKKDKNIAKKYNLNKDFFNVLYVGNEEPRMNVDTIIHSFAQLKNKNKKVRLIKIGEPNSAGRRHQLVNLIKKLKIENEIIFTDYVEEEDMPKIYNLVDLSIYPISYTGFGLPPLESMACGCPVITTTCSSLPEVVGKAAIFVPPRNVSKLTNAILKVMNDKKLRKELSKKGLIQSKKYTWKNCAEQTLNCYKSLY